MGPRREEAREAPHKQLRKRVFAEAGSWSKALGWTCVPNVAVVEGADGTGEEPMGDSSEDGGSEGYGGRAVRIARGLVDQDQDLDSEGHGWLWSEGVTGSDLPFGIISLSAVSHGEHRVHPPGARSPVGEKALRTFTNRSKMP